MSYSYDRRTAATDKHPDVVKGLVEYLKTGPFKSYLKVKSARGGLIVLTPHGLNDQVDRVEITDLNTDKAHFILFMKNGDSGWAWDEYRKPPKFQNDAGYNVLHLDRLANPKGDPEKFEQQMMSFCKGSLVPTIQKAGWVFDPASKRTVPLAEWNAKAKPEPEQVKPEEGMAKELQAQVLDAIKRIAASVKSLGVEVTPDIELLTKRPNTVSGRFALRVEHPTLSPYLSGIWFAGDPDKKVVDVGTYGEVQRYERTNVPLAKMKETLGGLEDVLIETIKYRLKHLSHPVETTVEEAWSVVTLGKSHGYATEVETFSSKAKAEQEARDQGNCYVVKGTQMWNEPLGQVEEHDRNVPSKFFP